MAGVPDESAGQSQAHGRGSHPFSFPSQPPDVRNWFSSYQYESPEVPELDAIPGGNDGSETQDPLEYRAPGHSVLKHSSQDGGSALKGGCLEGRSEHGEVSATRDLLQIGRSTVEQGTKRKRSLQELFGAGFLDDRDEATQTENAAVSPVHRTAVDHMCNLNWIGLQNRKCSHDGAAEHDELLVDSDSTVIAETQDNPRGGEETDHSKWPVNCAGNFNWIGLRNRKHNPDGAVEQSELLADSDGTILAETQENPRRGQETDYRKWTVNCGGTTLAADTEGFLEDGIEHCNLPVNSHTKGLADAGKTKQNLLELLGAGSEANESTSQQVSAVQRSAVDPLWKRNWVGLRNSKCSYEGALKHSDLLTDSESTCIAETQENLPGGQLTDHSKRPVNCIASSLAETEEGFLEDVVEHSNLPANPHSKGLSDAGKTKRSLRELFGTGFFDDQANNLDTRAVSAVQRNVLEPLSNCNAVGLPHTEQTSEGAAGYGELLADCDVISSAEIQETPPRGQMIEQNGLPVNCGGTSLAVDTEEGFLEDDTEHSKLPPSSYSTGPADFEKIDIEHHILPVDSTGISSVVTEKGSSGDETNCDNPTLNHKKTEGTVAGNGFIAIRTKVKLAEKCKENKTSKSSRARQTAHLQENRGILETPNALARDRTRSPLSDRTNFSEVAGATAPEISGKWKCPRKGKPYVAPPMKQLRLEQWVRRVD